MKRWAGAHPCPAKLLTTNIGDKQYTGDVSDRANPTDQWEYSINPGDVATHFSSASARELGVRYAETQLSTSKK